MITILEGIKVTTDNRGSIIYHLPQTYHRESFIQWKQDHKTEIDKIRNTAKKNDFVGRLLLEDFGTRKGIVSFIKRYPRSPVFNQYRGLKIYPRNS